MPFFWLHALFFWCVCHAEPFAAFVAAMQYPLLIVVGAPHVDRIH